MDTYQRQYSPRGNENEYGASDDQEMSQSIKELTLTVDNLSKQLNDFIETTSDVLSMGSRYPGSRQGGGVEYGTLPSTARSNKSLLKRGKQLDEIDLEIEEDDGKQDFSQDENKERGNWTGRLDFILSCLGMAVGLGNVWRFPYKCYINGGGAFLIPYLIMLIFVGIPIFYLELALGQYTSQGAMTCWGFAPMFQGIGWAMLLVTGFVCVYYNMIIAWAIFYLGASFSALPGLPWDNCDGDWANANCADRIPVGINCSVDGLFQSNDGRCFNGTDVNGLFIGVWNESLAQSRAGLNRQFPSEQYFQNRVLGQTDRIQDLGGMKWELVLSLFAAWVVVFFCLIKGIKSSGKVVYFTALFPYAVLLILLIRGVLLPGHYEGIKFYMTPDWSKLGEAQVWSDAANQIFFSLSASWGGLITLSSYNRFHNNLLRDTFIITIGNCATSVFAGFVIFSYLGHMAYILDKPVAEVAAQGTGLAFIVYPEAVKLLPISPLWSILFFLMLITLGLDSQFGLLETITTGLMDRWPNVFRRRHKTWIVFGCCAVFFAIGLVLCTEGGIYILQILDTYAGGWAVLFIGLFECISVIWVYGWDNFSNDMELMLGFRPWLWWWLMWNIVTPFIILFVIIFSWVDYSPAKYDDYVFPVYANAIGWMITIVIVLAILVGILVAFACANGSAKQRLIKVTTPSKYWGPALVKHRKLVTHLPNFTIDPWNDDDTALKTKTALSTSPYGIHSVKKASQRSNMFGEEGQDNAAFHVDSKLTSN